MESLTNLVAYGNRTLEVSRYRDYCPNGLQVAGRESVHKIVSGVTASARFLDEALAAGADAVLVHHGYFWKGEEPALVGMKYRRLKKLIEHDVALLAYHLPLDCHHEFGNNAQLAKRFGWRVTATHVAGDVEGLLWEGTLASPVSVEEFVNSINVSLGRECVAVGRQTHDIQRVAWCSGGGQRFVNDAADLGVDAYLSGEISEQTAHEAQEQDLLYVAMGHHASERYGVRAYGEHLATVFDLKHEHINIENPA